MWEGEGFWLLVSLVVTIFSCCCCCCCFLYFRTNETPCVHVRLPWGFLGLCPVIMVIRRPDSLFLSKGNAIRRPPSTVDANRYILSGIERCHWLAGRDAERIPWWLSMCQVCVGLLIDAWHGSTDTRTTSVEALRKGLKIKT